MPEHDVAQNMAREERRARRLGADAACEFCGCTTPEALTLVDRTLLEVHHVAGRAHDGLTVPVCRNCHAVLTEGQRVAGVDFAPQATTLERLAQVLRSLGAMLCLVGESLQAWADALVTFVAGLDADFPVWRGMEWARCLPML